MDGNLISAYFRTRRIRRQEEETAGANIENLFDFLSLRCRVLSSSYLVSLFFLLETRREVCRLLCSKCTILLGVYKSKRDFLYSQVMHHAIMPCRTHYQAY